MRKAFVLAVCLFCAPLWIGVYGCRTTAPSQNELTQTLYIAGRLAARAYLAEKPNIDEKTQKSIETAYQVFCALVQDGTQVQSGSAVYNLILAQLAEKLGPVDAALAAEAVQLFWTYFTREIDVDAVTNSELLIYLRAFQQGIDQVLTMTVTANQTRQTRAVGIPR